MRIQSIFQKTDNLFINALNENVFSGACYAFCQRHKNGYKRTVRCYGKAQYTPSIKGITVDTVFDLASLTKTLATVPVLLALFKKKIVNPFTELGEIFSSCPVDKCEITIKHLMSHAAGFVSHREYFNDLLCITENQRKADILHKILDEPLQSKPGYQYCYSDIGFILLGLIIEKISGSDLNELSKKLIYKPHALQKDLFFPGLEVDKLRHYASTENCLWTKKMLSGVVHDDNCRVLGGVAGHAGLFGTIKGVTGLCEQLLDQWKGRGKQHLFYSSKSLSDALTRVDNGTCTMGFDMVSKEGSSAGKYFSKESVGHLGFTGTSFWIDPKKECIVVLLTNRVHMGRDNWKIKDFRPVFHNLLMKDIV